MKKYQTVFISAALVLAVWGQQAIAQKKYDAGASDTEIKIGQTMPYSGPASAYSVIGKIELAYFKRLNENGGINGRKVNLMSLDDGYSPPKTVEMTRKLVEQDEVLFLMGSLGTAPNSAIHKYVNSKKIPHVFVASGASKWSDPKNFPWTLSFNPSYYAEGKLYALDILKNKPTAKIAILAQNDDLGKDYINGFKAALGDKAKSMIVSETTYEVTDSTIDSQMVTLKGSGADTFFNVTTPKFAALAIKKAGEIGWKPTHYLVNVAASINAVLKPAGLENAIGIITVGYIKEGADKMWENDPAMKDFKSLVAKYAPDLNVDDGSVTYGYAVANLTEYVLRQAGDNLTRENIMKVITNIHGYQVPIVNPGVLVDTSPNDYDLFQTMQVSKFDGKKWAPIGSPIAIK
jgi:branched-chain amino acid transport system substrate-binding protein